MARIEMETEIGAVPEVCFDLSRNVDFHASVLEGLPHRAVAGVTSGAMELGDTVTWEGRQFGMRMHMTSAIRHMDRPSGFVDEMTRGPFARWRHRHSFLPAGAGTLMRDEVDFASPFGVLGRLVDRVYMRRHMEGFLLAQNRALRARAEAAG